MSFVKELIRTEDKSIILRKFNGLDFPKIQQGQLTKDYTTGK